MKLGLQDIQSLLSVVDAIDFWRCFKLLRFKPIQSLYMSLMKQILGVQKQIVNEPKGEMPTRSC